MAELLKEAIADAKAVREVALQNAKMALEEAFDSKIKNMLSAKLAEEIEEDVELEEEYMEDEKDEKSEGMSYEEDDVNEADDSIEEDIDEEINLDELMAELEEMSYEEDDDVNEGKDDEEEVKEGAEDQLEESSEALLAALPALGITAAAASAYGLGGKLKNASGASAKMAVFKDFLAQTGSSLGSGVKGGGMKEESMDESIDIDALIAEIELDIEEGKKKEKDDDEKALEERKRRKKAEDDKEEADEKLKEALATVESLQETISEMNLLNSKLLYCNKLFRANALTEAQKVKVVDALDKAATTGEAKLVFETLQESFAFTGVEKRAIQEGLGRASKAAGVAPKKVLSESVDETVSRFQKLANINK